jgi:signal transduction histidine kinase/ActR/RegA family two-component response regulator
MKLPKSSKAPKNRFSFSHFSIQQRLPLFICLLLLIVIVIFSWTSYVGVKEASLETGRERLHTLTDQLSNMFQQSAQSIMTTTRTVARQEEIKRYLQSNKNKPDNEALKALEKLRTDSLSVLVQLWNKNHVNVLSSGVPGVSLSINLDSAFSTPSLLHDSAVVGKMYAIRDTIYYPIIAVVSDERQITGYIVSWKRVHATQQALEQFYGLMGAQSKLYFGNIDGGFWTDLINVVPTPPVTKTDINKIKEYTVNGTNAVMATIHPIPNTSWLIVVEFSKQKVLETANRFLYKIIIIGAILVIIGIFIAASMSRNITNPLHKLTAAAYAITEGDYSASVEIERKDELGKLALAFNTMASQVRSAQYDLEEKVQERTTELEKVKEAAERANQSKTRFLSSMSHEIRTPLNGILGFTEILSKTSLSREEEQEYLMHIKTAGELLSKLIGDILDLNKIEEGKLSLENESFNFKEFIESSLYPYKFQINENGVDFILEIDEAIPDYIISDRHRIHQLLVNLIGNSVKFTKKGQIGIKIAGEKIDEENFVIRMSVCDTGIGIPPDKFEKIFESFTQANETISRNYGGSGLGLAIVKHLVTVMNGKINVISPYPHKYSKGDAGSCFEIELPVKIDKTRKHHPVEETHINGINNLEGKNVSVLVVDDNIMNQKLASFLLEKLGCKTHVAGDGEEALELVKTNRFDVILMDVHMPVMDGYEASQIIRKQLRLETPIIGVTANVFKDDIEKCLHAGMNDHLGKPYGEYQLAAKISKWVMADVTNV